MFFHCSKELYEDGTLFKPRVPRNKMNSEEAETKRVCTSQSIDGCLVAIGGFQVGDIINIYDCTFQGDTYKPSCYEVPDVFFTGEEWILSNTVIRKLWQIEITEVHTRNHNSMNIDTYSYKFC